MPGGWGWPVGAATGWATAARRGGLGRRSGCAGSSGGRAFGRDHGSGALAELARDVTQDVVRKLEHLFAGLRLEPADGAGEVQGGDKAT